MVANSRQREIEKLQEEMDRMRGKLTDLQRRPDTTHVEIQTEEK